MQYEKLSAKMLNRLAADLSKELYYHGVHHTKDVLEVCVQRAQEENLSETDTTLLCTGALLHDTGFLNVLKEHEKEGVKIAREVLKDYAYSDEQIDQIASMIMATKIPQSPKTKIEKILCDADLDYLGRDDFYKIGNTLFQELKAQEIVNEEKDWDAIQIKFLEAHQYHTSISRDTREPQKQKYINELKEKWNLM